MSQDGGGRLRRIALGVMLGQERESHVHVLKSVPLDQSAHPEGCAVVQRGQIQTEAVAFIAIQGSLSNVFTGIVQGSDSFVADEAQKRGLVQQFQDETGVGCRHFPQAQSIGPYDVHLAASQLFARRIIQ